MERVDSDPETTAVAAATATAAAAAAAAASCGDIEDLKLRHNRVAIPDIVLERFMTAILAANPNSPVDVDKIIMNLRKVEKVQPAKSDLIRIYRQMCAKMGIECDAKYMSLLQKHPIRSESGVMVVAVSLSPYPNGQTFTCKWNCYYCPNKPGFPRSYLDGEPGIDRAVQCGYDPVLQMHDRLKSYYQTGHPTDKLEIIVLGGTWASYPEDYQYEFIANLYYGANTFFDVVKRPILVRANEIKELLKTATNASLISQLKAELMMQLRMTLAQEIKINETTKCRIIGLTLETRPDCIFPRELIKFREMGVTRIQMGVQHTNDRVLERSNRQCPTSKVIDAIKMLKDNCFKVDIHLMPDLPKPFLPGVDPTEKGFVISDEVIDWSFDMVAADKQMLKDVINKPELQADQLKLYAFQVVPYSEFEQQYKNGLHKSYAEEETPSGNKLIDLLIEFLEQIPPWFRVNRIIRDIPMKYIRGGCNTPNLNQDLIAIFKRQGKICKDIRSREVRSNECIMADAKLCVKRYQASDGIEYFLSFENPDETLLYGFLRLRITDTPGVGGRDFVFDELAGCALIRELHVYGKVRAVSDAASTDSSQHIGFGTRLLVEAERIAKTHGFSKIAVISGIGVREYYRKKGYFDGQYFLFKNI